MERISSGVFSGSPFFAYHTKQSDQISHKFLIKHTISRITYHSSNTTNTLRTNPGVSIMVRFGQCAYSALSTIGLGETAVLVIFKSASVRDLIMSAIIDAKTTGLPYSSESSSCIFFYTTLKIILPKLHELTNTK